MNTFPSAINSQSRRQTYIGAVLLSLPALFFWIAARVFLLPRLEYDWQRSAVATSHAQWVMSIVQAILHHGPILLLALAGALLVMELRFAINRRITIGATVFAVNSAVFLGLTAMCVAALIK